jgi:lipopolysaccharide/colanic/teichoic acid biosynthesis glycosyltransferase
LLDVIEFMGSRSMMRLLGFLGAAIASRTSPDACRLYSPEQMRRIIERERARSDRGNSVFAVLTLTFPKACAPAELALLAAIFDRRLRITDDAGLLAPSTVCLTLPETTAQGAWSLARDILRLLPAEMQRAQCDVYTHPASEGPRGAARKQQRRKRATNGAANNGPATNGAQVNGAAANGATAHLNGSSQPVRALLVRPLPAWKRLLDVTIAAIALFLLWPLFVGIAGAIKLTSPGPVFFRQQRAGLNSQPFLFYKFRTMIVGADTMKAQLSALNEVDGPVFKIRRDPRITRLGVVLRKTSLDELPQLWNVLRGDMSLVGPRPPECQETESYLPWQRRRLEATPGLTCIWQVSGRCQVSFNEWVRMDLRYIRSVSLAQDLSLLLKTVPAVIFARGAS